tara:strand:- start:142 stop:471 length:330 start_codon:yes stop_codon:yes gene_type:complete
MVKNPQNKEDDQFAFAITKGKFKDVVYKYNRFGLIEPDAEEEELKYRFEYDILEIPGEIRDKKYSDIEGVEFEKLIGDILIEVIQENIDLNTNENDEDRGHDTEESDIQ